MFVLNTANHTSVNTVNIYALSFNMKVVAKLTFTWNFCFILYVKDGISFYHHVSGKCVCLHSRMVQVIVHRLLAVSQH